MTGIPTRISFSDHRLLHGYSSKDSPVENFGTGSWIDINVTWEGEAPQIEVPEYFFEHDYEDRVDYITAPAANSLLHTYSNKWDGKEMATGG
jgi:hypothetical protein